MKRRVLVLSCLLALVFTMKIYAAESRVAGQMPILSFSGTTAYCYVECKAGNTSDEIAAKLTLYQGTTCVDSWSGTAKGRVLISGSCEVKSGKSYRLTLTYSVNGISKPAVSTTAVCSSKKHVLSLEVVPVQH